MSAWATGQCDKTQDKNKGGKVYSDPLLQRSRDCSRVGRACLAGVCGTAQPYIAEGQGAQRGETARDNIPPRLPPQGLRSSRSHDHPKQHATDPGPNVQMCPNRNNATLTLKFLSGIKIISYNIELKKVFLNFTRTTNNFLAVSHEIFGM